MTQATNYQIISPPFTLNFKEMEKKEIDAYFVWFTSIIQLRIEMLTGFVQSTQSFTDWKANYSPDSLVKLGKWFSMHVQKRPRTDVEKDEIYESAPEWFRTVAISDTELTNQTISLAIDIGMYLSQVFIENNPSLYWYLYKDKKGSVDYGQPVLAGFGRMFFNPVQIMVTLAYGLANNTHNERRLKELYDIWIRFIH